MVDGESVRVFILFPNFTLKTIDLLREKAYIQCGWMTISSLFQRL